VYVPNKTLSIRAEDLPLWERAMRAARHNRATLSAYVTSALSHYLGPSDTIEVPMYDSPYGDRHLAAFCGRWLTDPRLDSPDDLKPGANAPAKGPYGQKGAAAEWRAGIAETGRGRIAVYLHHWDYQRDFPPELHVFDDLDTAQRTLGKDRRIAGADWERARNALARMPVVWQDI
jgi:hypothetical protein